MKTYNQIVGLWQSYEKTTIGDIDKYLDDFRILFAFHSGKIENDEITYQITREIFENGRVINYTGSPLAIFEQRNQKLCYEFLKEKVIKKEDLSIALIKKTHNILTGGTYDEHRYITNEEQSGEFKKHDYITGIHGVGSAVEDVENDLTELLSEINEYRGTDILRVATYFHAKFEYIHPFADGNGRVGRTLMNYFLMIRDYPPLIVYDDDNNLYYECLQKYDETEEIDPLFKFFRYETVKTWGEGKDRL